MAQCLSFFLLLSGRSITQNPRKTIESGRKGPNTIQRRLSTMNRRYCATSGRTDARRMQIPASVHWARLVLPKKTFPIFFNILIPYVFVALRILQKRKTISSQYRHALIHMQYPNVFERSSFESDFTKLEADFLTGFRACLRSRR